MLSKIDNEFLKCSYGKYLAYSPILCKQLIIGIEKLKEHIQNTTKKTRKTLSEHYYLKLMMVIPIESNKLLL